MKPLEQITILDLSRVLACPFATMILSELGASVIKVERPGVGDETRGFEPFVDGPGDPVSAYYMACNRSKRSMTVNLRHPDGQAIIRELASRTDIVVENFPVGHLARFGLDYQTLRAVNERLIYLSCSGFGQTGPYADRKGYDTVFQAMSGLMSLTGEPGGDPVKPGLPVADLSSGLWAAIAILSAVVGRERSGEGCRIDLSMFDAQVSLLTLAAARFFALGEVPQRLGTEHPGRVPSASFRCQDGRWLHITASDQHWASLCRVLGLDEWADDSTLSQNVDRVRRRSEVMPRLRAAAGRWSRDDLLDTLLDADVPAGPVNDLDEVLADPHVVARGIVRTFAHPDAGDFPALGLPYQVDAWGPLDVGAPPRLGEHTDDILREQLDYSTERIATLRDGGAI